MVENGIASASEFRCAVERTNVERIILPASGLSVLLCRPPVFAALEMGRIGTQLQARVTDAKPEEVKSEDVERFTAWLSETLRRLFVRPRFSGTPAAEEIGLGDILIDDLKFIFRWLRGEVFSEKLEARSEKLEEHYSSSSLPTPNFSAEDLGRFPDGQRTGSLSGGSGETERLPSEPASGAHGNARVPAGLHRG